MKKIILACPGGVTTPNVWSGTPLLLYTEMTKNSQIDVIPMDISYNPPSWKRILMNWYSMFFYLEGFRNFFTNREWSESIAQNISDTPADAILYLAEYFYSKKMPSQMKMFAYVDVERYYWSTYTLRKFKPLYRLHYYYYKKNTKKVLFHLDKIFTMNDWCGRELVKRYGIDQSKIVKVGFGVNCKFLEEPKTYDNNLLLIILRKGREKYKGLKLLLNAFPMIREKYPHARLAVVGTDYGANIDGVECYYNQPRETTLKLLKEATLYVMPSLSEPNGVTYLEAMANKTPIVGLNRFAYPEFAGHANERGFIVNTASPKEVATTVIDALSDKDRLETMGLNGYEFVKANYSWDIVVNKIERIILNQIQ